MSVSAFALVAQSAIAQTSQSVAAAVDSPEAQSWFANDWVVWLTNVAVVLALFTLPFLFGNYLARRLRMPTIGGRIGFATFVIAVTLTVCIKAGFRVPLSIDIRGGTILVYEVLQNTTQGTDPVKADAVVTALQNRLNPAGTKDVSVRPYGENQIEVVVPNIDPFEVETIKKSIREAGQLKFRIVANQNDHGSIIEAAKKLAQSDTPTLRDVTVDDNRLVGQWYEVGRKDGKGGLRLLRTPVLGDTLRDARTGQLIVPPSLSDEENSFEKWLVQEKIENVDVLMALERPGGEPYVAVSGDDLASASFSYDREGMPAVAFNLNTAGSQRMFQLTAANAPSPDGNFHRRMAIILDERVLSAPQLNSPISSNGIIQGNFTREEVEFVVSILRAGKLPAALSPDPISESRIGALLGATTIRKGTFASILSVILTILCLLLYYRFSGIVAAFALILNGLMIWATMILIQQPLSLPGLAGMVLTLGMAVDANVLIYERIREEVAKGAASRMAIRNGFDRAFTTIVDSNLTTLIAAIVLYWIGTDQVRGFAVSLIIGIVISMFTAVFCARIVFDVAEKLGKASLSMSDGIAWMRRVMLGDKDLDFMSWQRVNVTVSIVIILIGLAAIAYRGRNFLAIDFNGGTSATIQLAQPIEPDRLRTITQSIFDTDDRGQTIESTLQRMEQEPFNTVYKIDTSFQSVDELKQRLVEGFAKHNDVRLVTYRVDLDVASKTPKLGGLEPRIGSSRVRLTAWQDPAAEQPPADVESTEADKAAADEAAADTAAADKAAADEAAADEASADKASADKAAADEAAADEASADKASADKASADKAAADKAAADKAAADKASADKAAADKASAETEKPEGTEPIDGTPAATTDAAVLGTSAPGTNAEISSDPTDPSAATAPASGAAVPKARSVLSVGYSKNAQSQDVSQPALVNAEALADSVTRAAQSVGISITSSQLSLTPSPIPDNWNPQSVAGYPFWKVELPLGLADTQKVADAFKSSIEREPVWLSLSNIGKRVAGDMQQKAIAALLVSLLFIVAYIWFRFQKLSYGLAAVVALLHDVLITLGIVALCHWLAEPLGFLMIEDFKIDLIMVAAFLTIIGYSLNDTIVVFDRIREVRGKSPRLTKAMVNASVNQTLSRTLLTSSTTLVTIALLYFFGGEGIHGFAFALFVGIVVGTYSSIFVASPVLLWIANRQQPAPVTAAPRGVGSRAV